MSSESGAATVWGDHELATSGLAIRLGPLHLHVHRLDGEWQIAHRQDEAEGEGGATIQQAAGIPPELETVERFASGRATGSIQLTPRPADRSLVARPRAPLHVLPGEESRFYVSAPVWVEVAAGHDSGPLYELPTKRLSDTWFGSSTRDGEVAYALRTHARTRLGEVPRRAHRAITPVRISNQGQDLLHLDRMNLPVPYLSIYLDAESGLWTEAVTLERRETDEMASFAVTPGAPAEAASARPIGAPRVLTEGSPLVRAFGRLLRPFQEGD